MICLKSELWETGVYTWEMICGETFLAEAGLSLLGRYGAQGW